jgi:hypothetical protein
LLPLLELRVTPGRVSLCLKRVAWVAPKDASHRSGDDQCVTLRPNAKEQGYGSTQQAGQNSRHLGVHKPVYERTKPGGAQAEVDIPSLPRHLRLRKNNKKERGPSMRAKITNREKDCDDGKRQAVPSVGCSPVDRSWLLVETPKYGPDDRWFEPRWRYRRSRRVRP